MKRFSVIVFLFILGLNHLTAQEEKANYLRVYSPVNLEVGTVFPIVFPNNIQNVDGDKSKYEIIIALDNYRDQFEDMANNETWSYRIDFVVKSQSNQLLADHYVEISSIESIVNSEYRIRLQDYHSSVNFIVTGLTLVDENNTYSDAQLFELQNGQPRVLDILPSDVHVELKSEIEYASFLPSSRTVTLSTHLDNENQEVDLFWNYTVGADAFEVEWKFLDENNILLSNSNENPFPNGTSSFVDGQSITTANTWFSIPNLFPKGTLFMHIRPIGKYVEIEGGEEIIKTGTWSNIESRIIAGHQLNANWQYSQTFAEEGKSKAVITYFDESLRSRQIQTNLSDENVILVAENKFDFEGRQAISILPTPGVVKGNNLGSEKKLTFGVEGLDAQGYAGYNYTTSNEAFNKKIFDNNLPIVPLGIGESSGAANYYSGSSVYIDEPFSSMIPDANGFPYTQTEYSKDRTGRILAQGGVGERFQLGSNHETKYIYSGANETELRRMFGSQVGDSQHYKKNIVIDANGQVSVSYLDKYDRVIATALAEEAPDNLTSITNQEELTIVVPLSDKSIANIEDRTFNADFTIPFAKNTPTQYSFSYSLANQNQLFSNSNGVSICDNCEYEYSLKIYDPAGLEVEPNNETFDVSAGVIINESGVVPCDANGFASDAIVAKYTFSDIGQYRVVKKLYLLTTPKSIDYYIDGGVIDDLEDPTNNPYNDNNELDVLSCIVNCEQCEELLILYPDLYQECLDICDEAATTLEEIWEETRCAGMLEQMKIDVRVGGWQNEIDNFLISNPPASCSSCNVHQIRNSWSEEFTAHYVKFHREYHHYEYCKSQLDFDSESFDILLSNSIELVQNMNPQPTQWSSILNILPSELNGFLVLDASGNPMFIEVKVDPFFDFNLIGGTHLGMMLDIVANDFNTANGLGEMGILEYLSFVENDDLQLQNPLGSNLVAQWTFIVGSYLYGKSIVRDEYKLSEGCLNAAGEHVVPCIYYDDADAIVTLVKDNTLDIQVSYEQGQDELIDHCSDLCSAKVENWMTVLKDQCNVFENSNTQEIEILLSNYCLSGCLDYVNPLGVINSQIQTQFPDVWAHLEKAELLIDLMISNVPEPECPDATGLIISYGSPLTLADHDLIDSKTIYSYKPVDPEAGSGLINTCEPCDFLSGFINFGEWKENGDGTFTWLKGEWNIQELAATMRLSPSYEGYLITPFHIIEAIRECNNQGYSFHESDESCSLYADNLETYLANFLGCSGIWDIEGLNLDHSGPSICTIPDGMAIGGVIIDEAVDAISNCAEDITDYYFSTAGVNLSLRDHFNEQFGTELNTYYYEKIINIYSAICATVETGPCAWPEIPYSENLLFDIMGDAVATPPIEGVQTFCSLPTEVVSGILHNGIQNFGYMGDEFLECLGDLQLEQEYNAIQWANEQYDDLIGSINNDIIDDCMLSSQFLENFAVKYSDLEYQYTLYYYDQAGNLIKTIAPLGFDFDYRNTGFDTNGNWNSNGSDPNHEFPTEYKYNSLNQLVYQVSPETKNSYLNSGSEFIYDNIGRLRFSRDAAQKSKTGVSSNSKFASFTKYDHLGRVLEVGEVEFDGDISDLILLANRQDFPNSGDPKVLAISESVRTHYGKQSGTGLFVQENIRNRVSRVEGNDFVTFYSYDIHGNVKKLEHFVYDTKLPNSKGRFAIEYEYDLISGNVNKVLYQDGRVDAFYHLYEYDADNRLTNVYTSLDNKKWENDARYFYHIHGPLARVELGEDKVQGLDYYYTLQGWIKGVNQSVVSDHGGDGIRNNNLYIPSDEMSYRLKYFNGDYNPINNNSFKGNETIFFTTNKELFNGNIAMMESNIPYFDQGDVRSGIQRNQYTYDQLHRIIGTTTFEGTSLTVGQTQDGTSGNDVVFDANNYGSNYSYDANGNIQTLQRFGPEGIMDNLNYIYNLPGKPNTLNFLSEDQSIPDSKYAKDVDINGILDYDYDEIGNLISDNQGNIDKIHWNIQGKVDRIDFKTGNPLEYTEYTYDGAGNRLKKTIKKDGENPETTIYIRDPQGNSLSTYKLENSGNNSTTYKQKELSLYGSSRIGLINRDLDFNSNFYSGSLLSKKRSTFTKRGRKHFELSNHLGNVLAVVSDKKRGFSDGSTADNYVDEYKAEVVSATDYYPFGMAMPERSFDSPKYRFGFNGKEKDESGEWGELTHYDYGFRIYNPGIGKFLSVDPLTKAYPELTPYQFASNTPIWAIDLDGLEAIIGSEVDEFGIEVILAEGQLNQVTVSGKLPSNLRRAQEVLGPESYQKYLQIGPGSYLGRAIAMGDFQNDIIGPLRFDKSVARIKTQFSEDVKSITAGGLAFAFTPAMIAFGAELGLAEIATESLALAKSSGAFVGHATFGAKATSFSVDLFIQKIGASARGVDFASNYNFAAGAASVFLGNPFTSNAIGAGVSVTGEDGINVDPVKGAIFGMVGGKFQSSLSKGLDNAFNGAVGVSFETSLGSITTPSLPKTAFSILGGLFSKSAKEVAKETTE